ncbi:sodium/potassium-transporting ATPase subunit beta-like isoform X2 [Mytilus californianus]|uniref:sodium/potassium-transporting ATPase subunit beta-like isoform X2 n=1 Tax=Mytilus californianus TaxID=6549 RepID=UPI002247ED69|nr:sodium/potassium-transporting ATPase subunit beta-like isoform X2 [Mytilus californianus]
MESKYDRVDVPDNLYLHSDDEPNDFGTGVYPISVISRKSNLKSDTVKHVKVACFRMRRKSRCFLMIGGVIFLIIVILLIVVASNHNGNDKAPAISITVIEEIKLKVASNHKGNDKAPAIVPTIKEETKLKGLLFEPNVDGSPLIHYSIKDMNTYHKYLNQLDFYMYDYSAVHQQTSDYMNCVNKSASDGKACRLTSHDFGSHCTHTNVYGYQEGRPCILLMLKLDNDTNIEPFTSKDTEITKRLKDRWSDDHVGITCDGETAIDREHMGHEEFWYENGVQETDIMYSPPTGFPVWFYPKMNPHYKVPAVMVHFNTIRSYHLVTIKCVAWAKSFNNGKPQDSEMYSVRFQIYME